MVAMADLSSMLGFVRAGGSGALVHTKARLGVCAHGILAPARKDREFISELRGDVNCDDLVCGAGQTAWVWDTCGIGVG